MNRKIKRLIMMCVFAGATIISCEKQNLSRVTASPMITNKASQAMIGKFMNLKSTVNVYDTSPVSFDYVNSIITSMEEGAAKSIVANQVGYDPAATVNYSTFAVVKDNGQLSQQYIVKITKLAEGMTEILYLNSQFKKIYAVKLDFNNKRIIADQNSVEQSLNVAPPEGDCADAVIACLGDAYTGHGWISVWAWIQSAVLPWTTAALAAGCVAKNCF